MKSNPTTYTIDIQPVGDHLKVTIPEIGVTIETGPGEVKRDDAEWVALAAISRYEHQQYEAAQGCKYQDYMGENCTILQANLGSHPLFQLPPE